MAEQAVDHGTTTQGIGPLEVLLVIDTDAVVGCPLAGRDVDMVSQAVTRSSRDAETTCQVVTEGDERCGYERTAVDETCPCRIFDTHDCIADIEAVRKGRLRYALVVPSRAVVRSIITDLRALGTTVSVERIRAHTPGAATSGRVTLTPKQREALAAAVEAGYYARPREATLEDLAEELDLTRSAVSQRLTGVERKLVHDRAQAVAPGPADD